MNKAELPGKCLDGFINRMQNQFDSGGSVGDVVQEAAHYYQRRRHIAKNQTIVQGAVVLAGGTGILVNEYLRSKGIHLFPPSQEIVKFIPLMKQKGGRAKNKRILTYQESLK